MPTNQVSPFLKIDVKLKNAHIWRPAPVFPAQRIFSPQPSQILQTIRSAKLFRNTIKVSPLCASTSTHTHITYKQTIGKLRRVRIDWIWLLLSSNFSKTATTKTSVFFSIGWLESVPIPDSVESTKKMRHSADRGWGHFFGPCLVLFLYLRACFSFSSILLFS